MKKCSINARIAVMNPVRWRNIAAHAALSGANQQFSHPAPRGLTIEKMTPVENIKEVEELFKMVYMWGRIGMQVDYKAPAFQQTIKEIKKSEYVCPADFDDIDGEDECPICKRKF